ncbi:hypothetical protein J2X63_000232 [Agromyces sp. 3263]|uniref:LmeA family phospholipid-binding protein n=1 Tax=Agromyces sp. 3263 TaxID=2817750 RepID=UPI0028649836|nr:DUF2993 domain-containing protein [Agromyces sp. 3263]MDR6904546.1 hypothetical protein [Agromyces sp. 3263]
MSAGPGRDDESQPTDAAADDQGATAVIPADEQATEVIAPAAAAPAAPAPAAPVPAAAPAPAADPAVAEADADAAPPRRRLSRAARIWITVVAIVVALVALVVVADIVIRNVAEARVAEEIRANLPDEVSGDVDVTIGGFSVIAQYLSGSMQQVELSAPELAVQGVPVSVDVVAQDVPVDLASPVGQLTATIQASPEAVNQLVASQGIEGVDGDLTFGDGTVGYTGSVSLLGFPIDYTVTARPTAAGDTVLLEPVGVELGSGGGSFDVSGLVDRLLGDDPVPVCVAQYLPEGVEVQQIAVAPAGAVVTLEGDGLRLDQATLSQTGSCPAG